MRRWWLAAVTVIALIAGALVFWPRTVEPVVEAAPSGAHEFKAVEVRASGSQQAFTLTGVVKDPTGQPVPNAEVFLAASSQVSLTTIRCGICNEWLLSCHAHESARSVASLLERKQGELAAALTTTSDAEGKFRFEQLSGISFTVWGRANGFGFGVKDRAAPGDPVELFLPLPRTLQGLVRDESGQPIDGASVRVTSRRLAQVREVKTAPDGRFVVDALGEGPFAVSATANDRLPALEDEAEAGGIPLQLTLVSPRRLEVRVVRDGQPIDAVLTLQGDHLTRKLEVKGGLLGVDALYPGELFATAVSGELSSVPTRVTLAAAVTQVTLTLDRAGTIAVTVLDEASQPVPKPTLELLTRGGESVTRRALQTGELVVLGPIGVGEYQLRASSPGYQGTTVPVQVKAGETPVELTLPRGTVISGRVVDEYGRPAAGVSVLVTPMGDSFFADGEGKFVAMVPSPGLYELHAHHSDWGGVDLKVTAPKENVELQLEPRGGAEITVIAEGRRVEGASVTLFHAQGNFRNDRNSGADGVVLMRGMPPDTYVVVASHPDYLSSARTQLTLRDGELQKITLELKTGGAIEGVVVDTMGVPVNGITVATSPRQTEPATTDAMGHFRIAPLRPGTFFVKAAQRGYEQVDRVSAKVGGEPVRLVVNRLSVFRGRVLGDGQPLKNFRVDEHEITSTDGRFELPLPATNETVIVAVEAPGYEPMMASRPKTPDLGDFDLKRAELVTGVVRDANGQGVADAVVTCEACEQSVLSDASGKFSIGKPAFQREFTLLAKKGRRSGSKTITVRALQGVEITLSPGVKMSGLAYLPSGQLAAGVEIAGINIDRGENVSVVTNEQGTYELELSPGTYRFMLVLSPSVAQSEDPPAVITTISGDTRLNFGPVPGEGTLSIRVAPREGYALWLVRGELPVVGNPPMELLHAPYAQLVYQPHTERVVLGALTPGRYTLVWSSFHAAVPGGPIVVPVQVPASGEVSLVR